MIRRRLFAVIVIVAALAVAPAGAQTAGNAARADTITLITGDKVHLDRASGSVAVEPAPGREHVGFTRETRRGRHGSETMLIPDDAARLLAGDRLDPRLFNVTNLARDGFTDAERPTLPLIVTYDQFAVARSVAPAGVVARRELPSVGGAALLQDKRHGSELWTSLTGAARTLGPGVRKVWLDGVSHPALDTSVAQIGGPAAWQAGFTGAGVTVAVLDTGIKADHPDLTGKVIDRQDFTESLPEGGDDVGHGTHVAGIVAGTGAASGGRYKGVAPDAKLLDGKVCVLFGCQDSWIIAGMEWAATKARVVNMSLGGGGTDGTDLLSEALNNLTALHGTLFVVAAGNDGGFDTVSTPAAADAALAVGNVTKQDQTSADSSRGPRAGDFAVKPDIAAPGTDIGSTRAKGTPVGDDGTIIDDDYHRISGTSMASPHVAGAAAILAQQHGDWTAERLKPTLMSAAAPTAGIYDQGAGRLDVARAVTQRVTTTGSSLSFGEFRWPQGKPPVAKTVTYRNDGSVPVTLKLALNVTGSEGKPAPAGMFTTSANEVTVAAGGTASVEVSAATAGRAPGLYGGRLTATADGVSMQTAVGAYLEPESYDLTMRFIGRNGIFEDVSPSLVNVETGASLFSRDIPVGSDGVAKLRLPKGRYDINAIDLSNGGEDRTVMAKPNVALSQTTDVTLDATKSNPVTVAVDKPGTQRKFVEAGLYSAPQGGSGLVLTQFNFGGARFHAVPSTTPVTDHTHGFLLGSTLSGADQAVYNLAYWEPGGIPVDTAYEAPDSSLAIVDTTYHAQGATTDSTFRFTQALYQDGIPGSFQFTGYEQPAPGKRTEYFSTARHVAWRGTYLTSSAESSDVEYHRSVRTFRPGHQSVGWNRAPLGPAFGSPSLLADAEQFWGVKRAGKRLDVALTLFSGSDPGQFTQPADGVTGTVTLSRGGAVIGTSGQPGIGRFEIPDSPGTYTLRAVAGRSVPWSVIGTKADVTWTFREPGAAAPAKPLPLFTIRATGDVDGQGRAPAGRPFDLRLLAQSQPGTPTVFLTGLQVEASYDDGATWSMARTYFGGDTGAAVLSHPAGKGFVSLRITAKDAAGNAVTQTVIRAYEKSER